MSWKGRSRGYIQTYEIHYRKISESTFTKITGIPDPGDSELTTYTVVSLSEKTMYEFKIISLNGFNGKIVTESNLTKIQTLGMYNCRLVYAFQSITVNEKVSNFNGFIRLIL